MVIPANHGVILCNFTGFKELSRRLTGTSLRQNTSVAVFVARMSTCGATSLIYKNTNNKKNV